MNGIQAVLLTGVAFIFLYFIIRLKKRLLDIIILFLMIAGAVVFILWPDLTTIIAKRLNVGRGTDLILYLSVLIFWFMILKLYTRLRKLEQMFTKIIRDDALKNVTDQDKASK
jgi:small membrane protein